MIFLAHCARREHQACCRAHEHDALATAFGNRQAGSEELFAGHHECCGENDARKPQHILRSRDADHGGGRSALVHVGWLGGSAFLACKEGVGCKEHGE